jgi:hypothetical protein
MGYENDIFISYKRDPRTLSWMCEHFLPQFVFFLKNSMIAECNRKLTRIFFDQTGANLELIKKLNADEIKDYICGIEIGADWNDQLRIAIKRSSCMLGILTPEYFQSDWCITEWQSFNARIPSGEKPIIAVSVHDGKSFPDLARRLQRADLKDYFVEGKGFRETALFIDFQKAIEVLADIIAKRVSAAPIFQDWPIVENAPTVVPPTIDKPTM